MEPGAGEGLPSVVVVARDATRRQALIALSSYAGLQVAEAYPARPGDDPDAVYVVDGGLSGEFAGATSVFLGGESPHLPGAGTAGHGYLPRAPSPEQLRAAVAAVAAGLFVSGAAAATSDTPIEDLTPREVDVLRLLADGLSNREMAARLGISENTVKFHVASLYSKLGVQNRAEAVLQAVRQGLLPL
jgi:DNA-binding CsgD family transcriptional regulator